MYDDYYAYNAQRKEQIKSEQMIVVSIATLLGGIAGGIISTAFFLLGRFDILSSGISALLFYICTYRQKWNNTIYIIGAMGIFLFSMLLQYIHKIFRRAYLLMTCCFVAAVVAMIVGPTTKENQYLIMGISFVVTACLGAMSWITLLTKSKN